MTSAQTIPLSNPIGMVIVDDHDVFREGLRSVVERHGHRIVGQAASVRDACRVLDNLHFDLLVVDLSLPGTSGISLVREMRRQRRPQPILMLTMHARATVAVEAIAAGATGFALKSDSRATLLDAIATVAAGRRYLSPALPAATIESALVEIGRGSAPGPLALLSAREREIFDLLVRGYENHQVAKELCISPKTVETHRAHIFIKLDVHSIADLLRFAFYNQLLHTTSEASTGSDASTNVA